MWGGEGGTEPLFAPGGRDLSAHADQVVAVQQVPPNPFASSPLRLWEQRPREPTDTTLMAVIIKNNNNNNKNPLLPGLNDPLHTFPSRSLPRPPSEGHWLFALLCLPRAQPDERTLSSSDSIACSSSSPQPRFALSPNWALANMIKAQLNVSW